MLQCDVHLVFSTRHSHTEHILHSIRFYIDSVLREYNFKFDSKFSIKKEKVTEFTQLFEECLKYFSEMMIRIITQLVCAGNLHHENNSSTALTELSVHKDQCCACALRLISKVEMLAE